MSEAEWETAKKDIRSILLTIQKGCTLSELRKDYKNMIGKDLPSAQFGFRSDAELLQHMPDVVHMTQRGYEFHLRGIADETTSHIQKMVGRQKPQKYRPAKNPKALQKVQPPRFQRISAAKAMPPQCQERVPSRAASQYQDRPASRAVPPRFREMTVHGTQWQDRTSSKAVPVQFQDRIASLVQKFPSGLSLKDFLLAYGKYYREDFQFRSYGFFTLDDCLQTIPDLKMKTVNNEIFVHHAGSKLKVNPASNHQLKEPEDKIKSTALNVKAPEFSSTTKVKKPPGFAESTISPYKNSIDKEPTKVTPLQTTPKGMNMSYSIIEKSKESPSASVSKRKSENLHSSKNEELLVNLEEDELRSPSPKIDLPYRVRHEPEQPEPIPPFVLKNLQKMADLYEDGIWATDFPSLYEDVIKTEFDMHSLGYNNLSSFIDAVPDIFKREDVDDIQNNWLIYPANSSKHTTNRVSHNSSAQLLDCIITSTQQMLQAYPEGIKLEEFEHIYSINCSQPLYIRDLGFGTIENFLLSIANRVPLRIVSTTDGKMVHLVQPPAAPVLRMAPNTQVPKPPPDIILPNTRLETVKLGQRFDYSKYFEVYTSAIETPGHLYIQIKGPQHTEAMQDLYNEMEAFYYSANSDSYRMMNADIRVGAVCVALWPSDNHWYRVEIMTIHSLECVEVFYFDYGTKEIIPTTTLRYMRTKYAQLPAQALLSSLAHLKPAGQADLWNPRARSRILQLCQDISLMARIDSVTRDGVLCLTLCDTNGTQDVYINDVLLNEGLADPIMAQPQDMWPQMQSQMLMQANFMNPFQVPTNAAAFLPPSSLIGYVPPPLPLEACVSSTSEASPTESEVFCDGDDEFFNQFYKLVVTVMKRYVKRIHTSDGYIFHILILEGMPYVSSGDIASLIWTSQDSDYLVQRLQNRDVILPSKIVSETDNKDLFHQIRRFFVKGCQKDNTTSHILVFSLDSVIEILNLFGQPSAEVRQRIQSELTSFNPRDPEWQELSEAEIPEKEEVSVATDDDKLNRLCLSDLQAMKEGIRLKMSEKMREYLNPKNEDVAKWEQMMEKVINRIEHIREVCDKFKYTQL